MSNENDKSTIKKKNNFTSNIYCPSCFINLLSGYKKGAILT